MAFLDVFQPCPTYNNINTKEWYGGLDRPDKQPRVYRLAEAGYDGVVKNPGDPKEVADKQAQAFLRSQETEKLPLGVFYQINLPTLGDKLQKAIPTYGPTPPAKQVIVQDGGKPGMDVTAIMDEYALKSF
jgi:2-oxoglutarate ferredoxin oxidoreductase subunit beta